MWILIRIWNTDPDQKAPEYGSNTDPDPQQCMLPLISLHLFPFSIILFCCDIRVAECSVSDRDGGDHGLGGDHGEGGAQQGGDRPVHTAGRYRRIDQSTQLAGIDHGEGG